MSIQFAFSTFFQRRFNVGKVISNVGPTLKQRHFARWGYNITVICVALVLYALRLLSKAI